VATEVIERSQVIQRIGQGLFDGSEDTLYDAIKRRRKVTDTLKTQEFQVGDKVTFNGMARPKYLQTGVIAEIVSVNTTGVLLKMPDSILGDTGGRFEGREVNCPAAIIDAA
jgi:hypothetical protein